MRKILLLDDVFPTGEQTVQPVLLWGPGRGRQDLSHITKTASEALDFIKNVTPEPGKTHLLLLALGSEEAYGPNRNGDGFPERPVPARNKTAGSNQRRWFVEPGEELTKHYQSFETNPAHAFQHHQNRDPAKASGKVKKAFWNDKMHRVELLVVIDNDKDPEWVERVNNGDFPPVSMGCSPRGTQVLGVDGRYAAIETLIVGDSVITHRGRARAITETMVRPHEGPIYHVKVHGYRDPIVLTGEHPLWLVSREQFACVPSDRRLNKGRRQNLCTPCSSRNKNCAGCVHKPSYKFDWVPTENAREGDYLALPVPTFKSDIRFTPDEARLLGYYLAEGCIIHGNKNDLYVQFCTGLHETETHQEIRDLATRLNAFSITELDVEERHGKYINLWDQRLAQLCKTHCGEHAKTKHLSTALMAADPDTLKIFLGAYANGDGGAYKNALYLSTASLELSEQLKIVLARCGMIASVNQIVHKPSKNSVVRIPTVEYQVWVGAETANNLTTTRLPLGGTAHPANRRFFYSYEGTVYLMSRIESIETTDYDDNVYNFSVAEDESYLIDGLAVHNCKIKKDVCSRCGNEAPTRAQYCDHVKFEMNKVNPDGTKNYVHNPSPNFFDISRVFRPADKTGFTLKKVASVYEIQSSAELGDIADAIDRKNAAIHKISDIDKIIRGEPVASSSNLMPNEQVLIKNFRNYITPRLPASPDLPMEALLKHSATTVFSTLASLGLMLKDAEFIEFVVTKMAGRSLGLSRETIQKTAALVPEVLHVFEASPALCDEVLSSGVLDEHSHKVSEDLTKVLLPYCVKRAAAGEMLYRRLVPEGIGIRPDAPATTDLLTHTDPTTGQTYQTTRGAAMKMRDANTMAQAHKLLGGGAMLLGGYKLLSSFPSLRPFKLPLALGTAALGYNTLGAPDREIMTNEGVSIPHTTEFAPPTKIGADTLAPLIVNLIESYARVNPRDSVKVGTVLNAVRDTGTVDDVRGLELDVERVAEVLGILATR